MSDERARRRAGGQIITTESATKVVDVLNAVLPQIKDFVGSMVGTPAPAGSSAIGDDEMMDTSGYAVSSNGDMGMGGNGDVGMQDEASAAAAGGSRQNSVPPPVVA